MTTTFTLPQLEQLTGVQARTLRHWIRKRLMPKPLGPGRGARYTQDHVLRAGAIRHLRSERASLNAIRNTLNQLSDEQIAEMQPRANAPVPDAVPEPPPEPSYPFQNWEVVTLMDGLVLLVSSSKGPALRRLANEIHRYYGGSATRANRAT